MHGLSGVFLSVCVFLPPATDGGEGHGLEFLLVGQSQAVLHRLVQQLLTLVGAPAWTVTVDDVLRRQTKAGGQHSWGMESREDEEWLVRWGGQGTRQWGRGAGRKVWIKCVAVVQSCPLFARYYNNQKNLSNLACEECLFLTTNTFINPYEDYKMSESCEKCHNPNITISQSPRWHPQVACFVWPTKDVHFTKQELVNVWHFWIKKKKKNH